MSAPIRAKSESIRKFIIANVDKHAGDIAKKVADKFAMSRQAANKHLLRLVSDKLIVQSGNTRKKQYALRPLEETQLKYSIGSKLEEDVVWSKDIQPLLAQLPSNALKIWEYGFTEMFNNVIDHSEGASVTVQIKVNAKSTEIYIIDDGVGIFSKIQRALSLSNPEHAVLELAKGKFTTDPSRHSGEGIFFASRVFDEFTILSDQIHFSHNRDKRENWIADSNLEKGTAVVMVLNNHTSRSLKKVFNEFATPDNFRFDRTIIPLRMAQYGDNSLVSRSQAKRILQRLDRFDEVFFDFSEVAEIGQGFADEVFRVFASQHPELSINHINANSTVEAMILRAKGHR